MPYTPDDLKRYRKDDLIAVFLSKVSELEDKAKTSAQSEQRVRKAAGRQAKKHAGEVAALKRKANAALTARDSFQKGVLSLREECKQLQAQLAIHYEKHAGEVAALKRKANRAESLMQGTKKHEGMLIEQRDKWKAAAEKWERSFYQGLISKRNALDEIKRLTNQLKVLKKWIERIDKALGVS